MSGWQPRTVVLGAGGMGALFGSILQEGGLAVTLVDSDAAHVGAIRDDGLAIEGFGGERVVRIPATTDAGEIVGVEMTDHLILGSAGRWVSLRRRGSW